MAPPPATDPNSFNAAVGSRYFTWATLLAEIDLRDPTSDCLIPSTYTTIGTEVGDVRE
jgi:hypothetical protein